MKMFNKKNIKNVFYDVIMVFIGTGIFSLGIHYFTAPNNIAPGGVSGIATFVNYLCGMPIGTITLAINIPLLILGFLYLGKDFIFRTFLSVILFTVFVDYIFVNIPPYSNNRLLASLFGGALLGAGLAIIFIREGSTGGTDIIAKITQLKFPHFSIGNLLLIFDFIVIIASVIVYKDIESGLYATVCMFVTTKVIDTIIYGLDKSKQILIISEKIDDISNEIMIKTDRGATFINVTGAYTNTKKKMLLICVSRNQFFKVKKIVSKIDPLAFMMISDVAEVLGEGFKDIEKITKSSLRNKLTKNKNNIL
ncbi:MAG: YitT family protein [Oscillospiraceae bacterium]